MFKLILVCLLIALSAFAQTPSPTGYPGQATQCGQPDQGCNSQVKRTSCDNWPGCKFTCDGGKCQTGLQQCKAKNCCVADNECKSRFPTASPTKNPTALPTRMPTPPTGSPTTSPTVKCVQPAGGCAAQTKVNCVKWNGCAVNGNVCQSGGCAPSPPPTLSPTVCSDIPVGGCTVKTTQPACTVFGCCMWSGGKCVNYVPTGSPTLPPPTSSPTPVPPKSCWKITTKAACVARADCVYNPPNKKCYPK